MTCTAGNSDKLQPAEMLLLGSWHEGHSSSSSSSLLTADWSQQQLMDDQYC
jgi:hypothetical protein